MVSWRAAKPVADNAAAAQRLYPKMAVGTIGNAEHLYVNGLNSAGGLKHGDHTPAATDSIPGDPKPWPGYVYALDLGAAGGFVPANFARWLVSACRAGKYPEVKYVCCDWRLWDRRYKWSEQTGTDGPDHTHISFRAGFESAKSVIVTDYWASTHAKTTEADVWTDAEKQRAITQLNSIDDVVHGGKGSASKESQLRRDHAELVAAVGAVGKTLAAVDSKIGELIGLLKGGAHE